jgi:hypothetical protein
MGAIGKLMAKDLGPILFQKTVTGINGNIVSLSNDAQIEAEWIINATAKQDSIFNQNDNGEKDFLGTTTLYLKGKRQASVSKSIVLIADPTSQILHFSFPSEVQNAYAPDGYSLCSISLKWKGITQNPQKLTEHIVLDLSKHYPSIDWKQFDYLAHFDIPFALPKWESGNEETFKVNQNRISIGDHLAYPSINGALRSGREAGEYVVSKLKTQ